MKRFNEELTDIEQLITSEIINKSKITGTVVPKASLVNKTSNDMYQVKEIYLSNMIQNMGLSSTLMAIKNECQFSYPQSINISMTGVGEQQDTYILGNYFESYTSSIFRIFSIGYENNKIFINQISKNVSYFPRTFYLPCLN